LLSDGLADELSVIAQVTDDWMLLNELQALLHCRSLLLDKLPQGAQVICPVALRDPAGLFDRAA
jgi:hypothetical protein